MSGTYLTSMAQWLRNAGLNVIEQAGWQSRARGSGGYTNGRPWCIMWHHTASNPSSDGQGDVNFIITAQDAPLSNLYINRAGTVWVIAAGATNTNGKGGPYTVSKGTIAADSMNTAAIGIEVANNGVGEPWPQAQIDAFFATSIALTQALGLRPDDICSHTVWAPGRKIDPAQAVSVQGPWKPTSVNSSGSWNLNDIKAECKARANGILPPVPNPPAKGAFVFTILSIEGAAFGAMLDDKGIAGGSISWLNPQRYNAYVDLNVPILELTTAVLLNCDLIGPIPPQFTRANFANVAP